MLTSSLTIPPAGSAGNPPQQHRRTEGTNGKALAELMHASRVMGLTALTACIVHELTQPLSGILVNAHTCAQLLAADPPDLDGARETADLTVRDSTRASEVIRSLRGLFNQEHATLANVDLNAATREVVALLRAELKRDRVILRPELADDLPPVTGDVVQLQQVILNLVQNARDAMSDVEGRPRVLVIRTERADSDRVRLSVRDTGVGLAGQQLDTLFEPFNTTKCRGMGIGLAISRAIVERHHGQLLAERNDGPGTTFSVSVPRSA
jgi:signal transduction histidine kinase